jgi:hypothetical protein
LDSFELNFVCDTGHPQLGQAAAWSEISFEHSGQLIKAMPHTPILQFTLYATLARVPLNRASYKTTNGVITLDDEKKSRATDESIAETTFENDLYLFMTAFSELSKKDRVLAKNYLDSLIAQDSPTS